MPGWAREKQLNSEQLLSLKSVGPAAALTECLSSPGSLLPAAYYYCVSYRAIPLASAMSAPLCTLCLLLALVSLSAALKCPPVSRQRMASSTAPKAINGYLDDQDAASARELLRTQLLEMCDQYKKQQQSAEETMNNLNPNPSQLSEDVPKGVAVKSTRGGLFGSGSFSADTLATDERSAEILSLIDKLVLLNPTSKPLVGWGNSTLYDGGYAACPLNGEWRLRFTNAADATFKQGRRGEAITSQSVNSTTSTITNVIRFPYNKGKVLGFDVQVFGAKEGDKTLRLDFRRVVVYRRSRFPRLLGTISVPLPRFFSWPGRLTRRAGKSPVSSTGGNGGPFLEVVYVDEDLRIHRTGEGNVFVQSKLYQLWDPAAPNGWTMVSLI